MFAESGGAGYALFRLADRGPVLVKAGGEIASGVTLVEVRPSGVRIRDHGEPRDIELRSASAAPAAAPGKAAAPRGATRVACTPPAGFKGPIYRLNAELLTGVASRPESWQALLAPVAGGLAVRDGSGFAAMLGMKSRDRLSRSGGERHLRSLPRRQAFRVVVPQRRRVSELSSGSHASSATGSSIAPSAGQLCGSSRASM